jgi:glutamyl/glutaminyl-tRNA synthetase
MPTIRERISVRQEFVDAAEAGEYDFAFSTPTYDTSLLTPKGVTEAKEVIPHLQAVLHSLSGADFSSTESIKAAIWPYAEATGKALVLWPLRTALSGRAQSPDPFTIAYILGQQETLTRIVAACDKIIRNG